MLRAECSFVFCAQEVKSFSSIAGAKPALFLTAGEKIRELEKGLIMKENIR